MSITSRNDWKEHAELKRFIRKQNAPDIPSLSIGPYSTRSITLLSVECKSGKNRVGNWYMYPVTYDNDRWNFFASEAVHEFIQKECRAGYTIEIVSDFNSDIREYEHKTTITNRKELKMSKQKLELTDGVPVLLKFVKHIAQTGTSKRGPWFRYDVQYMDEDFSFFAPQEVQDWIKDNPIKSGDVLEITMNSNELMPTVKDFQIKKINVNGNGQKAPVGQDNDMEIEDTYYKLFDKCMTQAESLVAKHPQYSAQAVATTLFIQCAKGY